MKNARVLVVEDEYFVALEVAELIRDLGAEVLGPFPRVPAALEAISRETPHAAVLDVRLNGDLSTPIAEELLSRGVPFLLATGHEAIDLPPVLREAPRVAKPFDRDALRREIAAMLTAALPAPPDG